MKKLFIIFLLIISFLIKLSAQEKKEYKVSCIAFYNVENLFDTINDHNIFLNYEFSPEGKKNYNTEKYFHKLNNIATVLSQIGKDVTGLSPFIIGLSEVENRSVLEDLVKTEPLAEYNYNIIHKDGPDHRGVDCALLYMPKVFEPKNVVTYSVKNPDNPNWATRDQLLVSGILDDELMHFIVIHWPSRQNGQKASEHLRVLAAEVSRHIIDSILNLNPNSKIFIMGDFNDDPINKSIKKVLNTKSEKDETVVPYMFNPMENLFNKGIGSLAYRDQWNLFDQIIISPALVSNDKSTYVFYQAGIFNKSFLLQEDGRFKGYPLRTYVGDNFMGGYSDHFPAYIYLIKEVKK